MFIWWSWWKTKSYENFKVLKFWRQGYKGKDSFFNHLASCLYSTKCKISRSRCRSHVQEIIYSQKHFWLSMKSHLKIFYVYVCKSKYRCTIMYTCEKSSPPSHELSYIGLFNFSHFNLFCINAINFCKKITL